jgi:VanZ family protein
MRRDWNSTVRSWGPVIVWASAIFFFSTESFSSASTSRIFEPALSWLLPDISPAQIVTAHLTVRKLGHWSEYFITAVLLMRALRNELSTKSQTVVAMWAIVWIILYAVSDEWHQSFVPSRTASVVDVMIDALGGICGIIWMTLRHRVKN